MNMQAYEDSAFLHDLDCALAAMSPSGATDALMRQLQRAGVYGMGVPRQFGGLGLSHSSRVAALSSIAAISPSAAGTLQGCVLGASVIATFGSNEQRSRWLPRFASGECIPSLCITELAAGSNIKAIETTFVEVGSGRYALNGSKTHISNAASATHHLVFARSNNAERSFAFVLVDAQCAGASAASDAGTFGLRDMPLGSVRFQNCHIPASDFIGTEAADTDSAAHIITTFGKMNIAAIALGIHNALLKRTTEHVNARTVGGRPLAKIGAVSHRLGQIYANYTAARALVFSAAEKLDAKRGEVAEIVAAKLMATELGFQSAHEAMHILGAAGVTGGPASLVSMLADLAMLFPPAGTSDVNRGLLARLALLNGMPLLDPHGSKQSGIER